MLVETITPPKRKTLPAWGGLAVLAMGVGPLPVLAQDVLDLGTASKITIVPRVSVAVTVTDNVFLSDARKRADVITQVSPGIRLSSSGGRIRGTLDYSLTELFYANNSSGRQSQNALNAAGTAEVVDNWAFVDFSGNIGQQSISAFGAPSSDGLAVNGNSVETSVFRVSPYVRGRLAGMAEYEARYGITSSRTRSNLVSDVDAHDASLRLNGIGGRIGSGWTLSAAHQSQDFSAGRSTSSRRIDGQVNVPYSPQWGGYVRAGYESNNYATANDQNQNTLALGVNWTPNDELRLSVDRDNRGFIGIVGSWAPSRRTSITVSRERRLFGDSHSIALAYRTARTAWTFSDSRNVVAFQGQGLTAVSLYNFMYDQFAAGETDPLKREQYASFLEANGIRPDTFAITGFLSSALSVQRQQQLSFTLLGARNTLTVVGSRSKSNRLDNLTTAFDDFSTSGEVHQKGLSVNLSHRISPMSVLSVVAAQQSSSGSAGVAGTSFRTVNVNLSTRINKDVSAGVGARHVVFDSTTNPYTETAVVGNVSVQF